MQHNIADGAPNASVSRRVFIAGMSAACVPAPAAAIAYEPDELDRLIFQTRSLKAQFLKIEAETTALRARPDYVDYAELRMQEVDPMAFAMYPADLVFRNEDQITAFFVRFRECHFGNERSRQRHARIEEAAMVEMRRRTEARAHWESVSGYAQLANEEDQVLTAWLDREREVFLFPCSDFSMVERKLAFIREEVDEDAPLCGEFVTSILMTMDGRTA